MSRAMIRKAVVDDIDAIKRIADANRASLGFVMRPALLENIARRWILVAERDGQIVGFVNYRHRQDSQTTIYEICVAEDCREQGIGRVFIDALRRESMSQGKTFIQLKAIVSIAANGFYEHLGFIFIGTEQGKRRALNVWKLQWT